MPAAWQRVTNASTPARRPETTVCVGEFRFATTRSDPSRCGPQIVRRGVRRGHRAVGVGGLLTDEPAPSLGEPQQVVLRQAARRRQGDELAVAVPGDQVRLDAGLTQQPQVRQLHDAQRGLRDVGAREGLGPRPRSAPGCEAGGG